MINLRTKVAVLVALSAMINSPHAHSKRYEGVQVVRYVIETPRLNKLTNYYQSIRRGSLKYDDRFRQPDFPLGSAIVDCQKTGRVGVTFFVKRSTAIVFGRGEHVMLRGGGLELTDNLKVDGLLTVRVSLDGQEIVQNSFSLQGCVNHA